MPLNGQVCVHILGIGSATGKTGGLLSGLKIKAPDPRSLLRLRTFLCVPSGQQEAQAGQPVVALRLGQALLLKQGVERVKERIKERK